MNDYGELLDESSVRFERVLPGPIERVWEYLTDGAKRALWLCGGETEPRVGGNMELKFHNATITTPDDLPPEKYADMHGPVEFSGTVTAWEPPSLLAHTWVFDGHESEVRYELETMGDDVRLVLTHRRMATREELAGACGGWHVHLAILGAVLGGTKAPPFWATHLEIEERYREQIGL